MKQCKCGHPYEDHAQIPAGEGHTNTWCDHLRQEPDDCTTCGCVAYRPDHGTHLSPRELQIAWLLADGKSNPEIGKLLDIAEGTTKFHVSRILKRFKTASRTKAAVMFCLERTDEAKERLTKDASA